MSCARAACSAASCQRPPQNSSHERPHNARALRGSSRSRHSSSSRSNSRASLASPRQRREGVHEGERGLLYQLRSADRRCEVVRAGGKRRRVHVADDPAEDRLHRLGAGPKDVVVELVGDLVGHLRVLERPHVALPEARGPRKAAMDDRLERRARACLLESLLEQRDRTIDGLELGKEDESLGPQRPGPGVGQQVRRDRPRPRPFTRRVMCTSRGQSAPLTLLAGVRGVSRSACSASSAAAADAPRSTARTAAASSSRATAASGVSVESAR